MSVGDRYIGEQLRPTDIVGLIDSDTGNIDAALMPTLSGQSYVSANQTDRLAGTHTGGTVVGGFVVGDVVYQLDTEAYWLVASLPSSVAGNWAPWSVFASSQDTGGGVGNAGKLLALDANGKADGRDLATDGTKLDGIAAGAAALTSSTPAALGVAAVGVATTAARGDHVHAMPSAADVGADPTGTTATHAALTTAHGSTALNTASAIVQRDASGNFAAGTITANLTGTASGNDVVGAAAAVQTNLTTHLNDTTDAHLSTAIGYTPTTGSDWVDPDPTTVGGALDTAAARVKALEAGTGNAISFNGRTGAVSPASGDYTASQVTNTPAGSIAATDVQAAINELDTEKQPLDPTLTALAGMTTGADDILFFSASDTPAPAKISEKTEATTAASNDWLLMETAAGNLRKVAVGNISGSVGSAPSITGTGAITHTVRTADVSMSATTGAAMDCTTDALVATLPSSPSASTLAEVMRYAGTTCRTYVKPAALGANILASPQLITLGTAGEIARFQYIDSTMGWAMSRAGAASLTCPLASGTQIVFLPNATWTKNGATLSALKDHSGNGYNATQATAGFQPTYAATGSNSGPSADFDGIDDFLTLGTSPLQTTGAFWVAGTFIPDNVSSARTILSKDDRTTGNEHRMFQIQVLATGEMAAFVWDQTAVAWTGKQSSALSGGTRYTFVFTYDGAGGTALTLNGVNQATVYSSGVFSAIQAAGITGELLIGAYINTSGAKDRFFDGDNSFLIAGTGTPTAAQIAAWYTFGNSL